MQVLYEVDLTGHSLEETLERVLATEEELATAASEDEEPAAETPLSAADRALHDHVRALVRGAFGTRPEADRLIEAAAPAFPIDRVPVVDRNVLRLAVHELLNEPDVPTRVAINEAVELAKRFGGESSGRFVNGVLGTIAGRVEPAPSGAKVARRGPRAPARGGADAALAPSEAGPPARDETAE